MDGSAPTKPDNPLYGVTCGKVAERLSSFDDSDETCIATRQIAINRCGCPYDESLPTCNLCGSEDLVIGNLSAPLTENGITCNDFLHVPAFNGNKTCEMLGVVGVNKRCSCKPAGQTESTGSPVQAPTGVAPIADSPTGEAPVAQVPSDDAPVAETPGGDTLPVTEAPTAVESPAETSSAPVLAPVPATEAPLPATKAPVDASSAPISAPVPAERTPVEMPSAPAKAPVATTVSAVPTVGSFVGLVLTCSLFLLF